MIDDFVHEGLDDSENVGGRHVPDECDLPHLSRVQDLWPADEVYVLMISAHVHDMCSALIPEVLGCHS